MGNRIVNVVRRSYDVRVKLVRHTYASPLQLSPLFFHSFSFPVSFSGWFSFFFPSTALSLSFFKCIYQMGSVYTLFLTLGLLASGKKRAFAQLHKLCFSSLFDPLSDTCFRRFYTAYTDIPEPPTCQPVYQ